MAYAGIETTLELWALSLREVKARMRPLFTQERVAASAGRFLDVLLSDERRKTGWMRAEAAGDPGPWRQQAILGRGHWDAEALRDIVREYVLEPLADPDAVLVVDETGFLKQGKASVGVARQYRLSGQDHQLPDWRVRRLRLPPRPRLHRSGAISAAGLGEGCEASNGGACAERDRLRHQAHSGAADDRASDRRRGAVCLGCSGYGLSGRRDRDGAAARRQRLHTGRSL